MLTIQAKTRKRKPRKATAMVVTSSRPLRSRNRRLQIASPLRDPIYRAWIRTLEDPFEYGPISLGYDCYVPTSLTTAYLRGSITTPADGSFTLVFNGDVTNFVTAWNTTASTVGSTATFAASNLNQITLEAASARMVSGGIRAFALLPATATPGVLFVGNVPQYSYNAGLAYSTNSFIAMENAELGIGTAGASSVTRPVDAQSFEFFQAPIVGYTTSTVHYSTVPFISGVGFPATTRIYFEAVMNIEFIASSVNVYDTNLNTPVSTLSSVMPSAERAYSFARSILTNPVVLDAAVGLAGAVHPSLGSAARSIASRVGNSPHGRRARQLTPSTGMSQRASAESRVVIEELKEDNYHHVHSGL